MRKLASIREIKDILPIENADRIELAIVDGWQCVVKKGEFVVGDKCVYFEIDSLLPDIPAFEFMADRKFRVKTIKLRGQISQGLALRLDALGLVDALPLDYDVTDTLGVKKYEPKAGKNTQPGDYSSRRGKTVPWYRTFPIINRIHRYFYPYAGAQFPPFVRKTDETRVQNIRSLPGMIRGRELIATEKLDGQSATYFYHRTLRRGFSRGVFGVCSRNLWLQRDITTTWWQLAEKHSIEYWLRDLCEQYGASLAVQGEIVGPGVQGNKYNLPELQLFVFGMYDIDNQRYLGHHEYRGLAKAELQLDLVPEVAQVDNTLDREDFLAMAEGNSVIGNRCKREGIVIRDLNDQAFSFKAISNSFLLKHGL